MVLSRINEHSYVDLDRRVFNEISEEEIARRQEQEKYWFSKEEFDRNNRRRADLRESEYQK